MKKLLLSLGLLFIGLAIFAAWFVPSAFLGSPTGVKVRIEIPADTTVDKVGQLLAGKNIINSSWGYLVYSYIDVAARHPRAGFYDVVPGSSYRSLARQFALGPSRDEFSFRLLEGQTLDDETAELLKLDVSATSIQDLIGDSHADKYFAKALRQQYAFLKDLPDSASLEGYLFPDTYRVWKDQLPLGLVLKQLQTFSDKTSGMADEAVKQGRTFKDVMVLASIVEKEGRTSEEKKVIAGIFLNRIKTGMRLQSDATVNYATRANRARPTLDDLNVDSPYYTYRNDGLPPGPICNPGMDSIEAALNPTPSDYLYYLHDAQGKVYYAKTIDEHRENRRKAFNE